MARRILFIIGSLDVGGTQRHLAQLTTALADLGWEVSIYCLVHEGMLGNELRQRKIVVRAPWLQDHVSILTRSLPGRALRLILATGGLIAEMLIRRPAIVHFFLPENYVVGGFCALITGCSRLVMSRRSLNLYQTRRPILRPMERFLHRRMTRIVGNSRAVVAELRMEGAPEEKLRLIYNGVELPTDTMPCTKVTARQSLGIPVDAFVMLLVANLIPYKGHTDLLNALEQAKDHLPRPWRLLCVGQDHGIGLALKQQALHLGIADNIAWLGLRTDVDRLYAAADLGLLVSHEEGFSNAVLEGMAAALPMVVTDVGGNAEAVINGETGLIVPPRSPQLLADAILTLALDRNRAAAMGRIGRDRVARNFSFSSCIDNYRTLYAELLAPETDGCR